VTKRLLDKAPAYDCKEEYEYDQTGHHHLRWWLQAPDPREGENGLVPEICTETDAADPHDWGQGQDSPHDTCLMGKKDDKDGSTNRQQGGKGRNAG
jgi:hypothetical protein